MKKNKGKMLCLRLPDPLVNLIKADCDIEKDNMSTKIREIIQIHYFLKAMKYQIVPKND